MFHRETYRVSRLVAWVLRQVVIKQLTINKDSRPTVKIILRYVYTACSIHVDIYTVGPWYLCHLSNYKEQHTSRLFVSSFSLAIDCQPDVEIYLAESVFSTFLVLLYELTYYVLEYTHSWCTMTMYIGEGPRSFQFCLDVPP